MSKIAGVFKNPEFRKNLESKDTGASIIRIYRGGKTGDYTVGESGDNCEKIDFLQGVLDQIKELSGLEIADANIFSSSSRTTFVVNFAIDQCESKIAVYYDSRTDVIDYQILHPHAVMVAYASQSELLIAHANPDNTLEAHFDSTQAEMVRRAIAQLGLKVVGPTEQEIEYETHSLQLESAD